MGPFEALESCFGQVSDPCRSQRWFEEAALNLKLLVRLPIRPFYQESARLSKANCVNEVRLVIAKIFA